MKIFKVDYKVELGNKILSATVELFAKDEIALYKQFHKRYNGLGYIVKAVEITRVKQV